MRGAHAEQDAVGIDQKDDAVGVQLAVDLRRTKPAGDAIEQHRGRSRLEICTVSPAPTLNVFQLMMAFWATD